MIKKINRYKQYICRHQAEILKSVFIKEWGGGKMKSNNIISYLKLVMCILSVIASAGLMACSNIHNNGSKSSSNDLKPLIIGK